MIFVLSGLSKCFVQRSGGSNTLDSKFIVFAVSYGRICPSPKITYFVVVSASNPIGPLACNFCVLIPISAPNPNSNPSVNLVDALTYTAAASISSWNFSAFVESFVMMDSECPVFYLLICAIASSIEETVFTEMIASRYSVPQSSSVAGTISGTISRIRSSPRTSTPFS